MQLYIGVGAGVGGTHIALQPACVSWPEPAVHVLVALSVHVYCPHAVLHNASVVYVPCASTAHAPVVAPQLYIGADVGGTHVVAQLAFVSVPDPATHVLVAGSLHV